MKTLKHYVTALLLLCSVVVSAHDFEVDGIYYKITNSTTKEVAVTYSGNSSSAVANEYTGSVVIPESVTYNDVTYSVTSIGNYAFRDCSSLTSVEIPNSVTSIGNSAFYCCKGLTSIEIPNSVTSIGDEAFSECNVNEVHISNLAAWCNIDKQNVFSRAYNLYIGEILASEITIPDEITEIKQYAFECCWSIVSVEIGNNVTSIGSYAFNFCHGLTSVEIPNSVTSIGKSAFRACESLASVKIGNSVAKLGERAFESCSSLKEVHISDIASWCGIDVYDYFATPLYYAKNLFMNGKLVTEVVIPAGVTEIKRYAFYNCDKIVNVTIPSSVTSIANEAFSNVDAVFDIAAETPATVRSSAFHEDALFIVPAAAVDTYKAAWSSYANKIIAKELAVRSVEIEASEVGSALRNAIGDEFTTDVIDLTVKGTINSYDVIVLRTKMPLLRKLDLSGATVMASDMAFYKGNCTKDNDLGDYAFYGLSKLNYVKLPKDLVSVANYMFDGCNSLCELEIPETVSYIGECAFMNCCSLTRVEMPEALQTIESAAFKGCSLLKSIVIPKGVKFFPDYSTVAHGNLSGMGLFADCSALESVILPDGLENIGEYAFDKCNALKEIKLPPTVKTIDNYAFRNCSSLETIRIPSSLQSIASSAFVGCNNVNKVYSYTLEPLAMTDGMFPSAAAATLYAPSQSRENYYFAAGWNSFLKFEFFDEPYEYFYVNNDYTLNDDTGYIKGTEGENPDADINAGGGFIVEGEQGDDEKPNQNLGDVNVGSNGEGTSGSIIGDNNLHIDDLFIRINVKGGRWYFFAFPFDIKLDKISMENGSDYVFRYYDGEERAKKGNGGWKDINENHLKAARGYIFQCAANDVLVLNIENVKFKKEDKYNELVAHVSNNLKDASWNFTGNPYLSYYDMADMDYTAPVTVWDGSKYIAIRPGDDDYHFAPYEAFFVQKPEGQDSITFNGQEQMTKNQSNKKKEKQAAARRARSIDPERLLINLVLDNGTSDDRTRIVFNERQSLGYETSCDATKFETAGVAQLYTIGSDNVHYAINERPADNGRVVLGYTAPTAGFYTIEAQRMDAEVYVKDFKTGTLHNLKDGAYSFGTDAGTFNDRFEILLKGTAPGTTGIDELKGENGNVKTENGEVKTEIYDLQGRKMQDAGKGIYIINGEKVVK